MDKTTQEKVGSIAIILFLVLIIALNVTSYAVYYFYPPECFENPYKNRLDPDTIK